MGRLEALDVRGRLPPHDLDAEAAVLSAILLSREALDRVLELLRPEHFYSDANGRIYEASTQLAVAGTPIDIVSVASWLRDREWLAQIGGASYLAQLADATPAVAHVGAHAAVVYEKWRLRQLIATCQRVAAEGYGDVGVVPDFIDGAEQAIFAIATGRQQEAGASAREVLIETFRAWQRGDEGRPALSTGLPDLDRMIGGLRPGHLVTVAAHSGVGKSALAAQIAQHVATRVVVEGARAGVAVFTLEMDREEYIVRLTANRAGVNNRKLLIGSLRASITAEEWRALSGVGAELAVENLHVDDRVPLRPSQIRATCRRLAAQWLRTHPLRLVVVDYAQILTADGTLGGRKRESREQEVASIGRAMKELAGEVGVTVLLLAQLNQESVKAGRRPRASDLRESTALMNDSNAVLLIYNPAHEARALAYRNGQDRTSADELEEVDIIAGKVRGGGEMGSVRVLFRPSCTRFESWTGDPGDLPTVAGNAPSSPQRARDRRWSAP